MRGRPTRTARSLAISVAPSASSATNTTTPSEPGLPAAARGRDARAARAGIASTGSAASVASRTIEATPIPIPASDDGMPACDEHPVLQRAGRRGAAGHDAAERARGELRGDDGPPRARVDGEPLEQPHARPARHLGGDHRREPVRPRCRRPAATRRARRGPRERRRRARAPQTTSPTMRRHHRRRAYRRLGPWPNASPDHRRVERARRGCRAAARDASRAGRLVLVARRAERLEALAAALPAPRDARSRSTCSPTTPPRRRARTSRSGTAAGCTCSSTTPGAAAAARSRETATPSVRATMELNFDAQLRLTEALLPLLRASAPSAIVNVASTAGADRPPGRRRLLGLEGGARGLERRAARRGARRTASTSGRVLPGFIPTEGFPQRELRREAEDALDARHARGGRRGDLPGRPRAARPSATCRASTARSRRCGRSRPASCAGRWRPGAPTSSRRRRARDA